jgi:serine/threonine protein kinase/Flp pilus assembly protein TadD
MEPERWQRILDLFHVTITRQPNERITFLDQVCDGDQDLRRQVERMVKSHEQSGDFLESPAFATAPELLTDDHADALVGERIGHYRIESLLGVGGMGEVYLAQDERLGRKVALKLLPERLTADAAQLSRFEHEARTASALNHPNILTVHEIGADGRRHFIATEFIEGETLRALLRRGKLDLREVLDIALQIGSALAAAHKSGVLHRDIKPENIMLRPDAYVKVLDFGIAKLTEQPPTPDHPNALRRDQTESGLVLGTARYMSPEQARGQAIDARTDIWSFGAVLYEMLAGSAPFEGETPSDCIAAVLKTEPPPLALEQPDVPTRLEQIVQKALRKNKDERHQSVEGMLAELRDVKEGEFAVNGRKRQKRLVTFAAAGVALALVLVVALLYLRPLQTLTNSSVGNHFGFAAAIPEKSIAVLPFTNLSGDHQDAFIADGVQDEVLTALAKIADLRVISRTSAMQYADAAKRNLPEIGQALRVAHVLEASVQRTADRIRVNARLIDAQSDVHLWAQTYDRDVAGIFAIPSEIAKTIATQLRAKLSPSETAAIEAPPTADLAAFDLYTRGKTLVLTAGSVATYKNQLIQATELFKQAIARDSQFFRAHCELANTHAQLYFNGDDHTPERLALTEEAIQTVVRLRPDDGETHLALAEHLYKAARDYDRARAELTLAQRTLPNDPRLFKLAGYIDRRQGRWDQCIRNLERAIELAPRDFGILRQIANSYQLLRRYSEQAAVLDRVRAIIPQDLDGKMERARVDLDWRADTRPLRAAIEAALAENPVTAENLADSWLLLAFCERDPTEADRALVALTRNEFVENAIVLTRNFGEGVVARMRGDSSAAQRAFSAARLEHEEAVRAQPGYAPALCVLGLIDAGLGRKEEALREGRQAVEMTPLAKEPINGAQMIEYFAIIAAWTGEKDLAIEQLETVVQVPSLVSYGKLKLHPFWDPLRGDPRFEKIVAFLAPKEAKSSR